MKKVTIIVSSILCLTVISLFSNCATTMKSPDNYTYERFCGVWANTAYEPEPGTSRPMYAKVIINPDGTMLGYINLNDTGPTAVGRYTVKKRWSDDKGGSYYHVIVHIVNQASTRYETWKINRYNSSWEVNWSNLCYPEEIDPKDLHSSYHIHYRY